MFLVDTCFCGKEMYRKINSGLLYICSSCGASIQHDREAITIITVEYKCRMCNYGVESLCIINERSDCTYYTIFYPRCKCRSNWVESRRDHCATRDDILEFVKKFIHIGYAA